MSLASEPNRNSKTGKQSDSRDSSVPSGGVRSTLAGRLAPSIHVIPEGHVAGDGSYAEDTKEAERRESRTKKRKTKKKPAGFGP